MFEALTLNSKNRFDSIGTFSESLLFYQKSILILGPGSLTDAIRYCGYENLVELVKSGQLELKYAKHALGGGNQQDNLYHVSAFSSEKHHKNLLINQAVEEIYGRNIKSNNIRKHLHKLILSHDYSTNYNEILSKELRNVDNIKAAISVESKGKIEIEDIKIASEEVSKGLYNIESNIDNQTIAKAVALIAFGSGDLFDAQMNNSALALSNNNSNYAEDKINRLINQFVTNGMQIKTFHEKVLPEYIDLKGTMDSGGKDFNDFMYIWREAQRFKDWLAKEEPTVELLTAYIRKISERTWLDKLPTKNMRWLIFAGLSTYVGIEIDTIVGIAAGLGIDYFDEFLLERLISNWKPDQFVQGEYKDFLHLRN